MNIKPDAAELAAIAAAYVRFMHASANANAPVRERTPRWREAARLAILDQSSSAALDTERRKQRRRVQ